MIGDWGLIGGKCKKCGADGHLTARSHEDDEGHEDWEYHCSNCEETWFVDGADS